MQDVQFMARVHRGSDMGSSPGTRACYAAAGIFTLSGFLLSGASVAIVMMIVRDDKLDEQLWTAAVLVVGVSFGVLCLGILVCACAMCKRMAASQAALDKAEAVREQGAKRRLSPATFPAGHVAAVRVWSTAGSLDPLLPGQVAAAESPSEAEDDEQPREDAA
ncbi:uncharacterized protein LOC142566085 isoform X1 [Dermacentor variabilis]|uniref:uncharacterized protein LOC142566085 isoform X1 n=1 Tax=Dermacentor variabilis TaxID=34621 RepID=UPI003F5BA42D